jgi:tRNA pseudouridine38-40 synthase
MRYFISLSYDGSLFCGWQSQPNAMTIQDSIEKALSALLRCRTSVTGAGRTDSGVNACGYVAHFDFEGPLDTAQIRYKLNAILPRGIVVHNVLPVSSSLTDAHGAEFHARFSATRREYTYFLHRNKDPFVEKFSLLYTFPLDFEAMNRAAALLVGTHDFSCFQKIGSDAKTSICTVTEAFWKPYTPSHIAVMGAPALLPGELGGDAVMGAPDPLPGELSSDCARLSASSGSGRPVASAGLGRPQAANPEASSRPSPANTALSDAVPGGMSQTDPALSGCGEDYWYFRISADRFLRNMVRAVVGSLLEVGRGKRSVEDFSRLLDGGSRSLAGESVPGHPLFLSKVKY